MLIFLILKLSLLQKNGLTTCHQCLEQYFSTCGSFFSSNITFCSLQRKLDGPIMLKLVTTHDASADSFNSETTGWIPSIQVAVDIFRLVKTQSIQDFGSTCFHGDPDGRKLPKIRCLFSFHAILTLISPNSWARFFRSKSESRNSTSTGILESWVLFFESKPF